MQTKVVQFYSEYFINHHRKSTISRIQSYPISKRMRGGPLVSNDDLLKKKKKGYPNLTELIYFHHTIEWKMWCLSFKADAKAAFL